MSAALLLITNSVTRNYITGFRFSLQCRTKLWGAPIQTFQCPSNSSKIYSAFLYNFSLKFFKVSVQFFVGSFKNWFENFTKLPSKYIFKSLWEVLLYFFKVFLRLIRSFFPVSLKLFQKNFPNFLHNINNVDLELL